MKALRNRRNLGRLVGLIDDMLDNAQTIRIIQVQSRIAKRHKEKADAAWQHLNAAHKAATELLQPNTTSASREVPAIVTKRGMSVDTLAFLHHTHGYDPETVAGIVDVPAEIMTQYHELMDVERARSRAAQVKEIVG